MRRIAPAFAATLLSLGLLVNFHTSPAPTVSSTANGAASPTSSTTTRPPVAGASPGAGDGRGGTPATVPPPTTATRVVDGPAEVTRYGIVQVQVTLSGNQIVDVQALQLPSAKTKSQQISTSAEPRLLQEVLAAQSAQVDTISGATYTSIGYQQSLQAALDAAGRP
jgi:uncharacterized protein with FMN-binding domain